MIKYFENLARGSEDIENEKNKVRSKGNELCGMRGSR